MSEIVKEVMDKMPDDIDIRSEVRAAISGSLSLPDALGWLNERGIAVAVVFDEEGQDVGMLDVESLVRVESLPGLPDVIPAAYLEKCCPIDRVPIPRRLDDNPDDNGKYWCPRHKLYHCEPSCP